LQKNQRAAHELIILSSNNYQLSIINYQLKSVRCTDFFSPRQKASFLPSWLNEKVRCTDFFSPRQKASFLPSWLNEKVRLQPQCEAAGEQVNPNSGERF